MTLVTRAVTERAAALSGLVTTTKGGHMGTHILEPAAQELTDATATPLPVRAEHRPDNQFAPYSTARRSTS
jgi:hypothetical protein